MATQSLKRTAREWARAYLAIQGKRKTPNYEDCAAACPPGVDADTWALECFDSVGIMRAAAVMGLDSETWRPIDHDVVQEFLFGVTIQRVM